MLDDMRALDDYRYTGHAGLLGKHVQPWHATGHVLQLFSNHREDAQRAYRRYIADGMNRQDKVNFSGGGLIRSYGGWEAVQFERREHELRIGDERILGKSDFVDSILKQDVLSIQRQSVDKREGWDLPSLIKATCHHCGIQDHMLSVRGRMTQVSRARQILAYFAITELDLNAVKVASYLRVSLSGVSKMVRKGRDLCRREGFELSKLKRLA